MNAYWTKISKDFHELFPNPLSYFLRVLVIAALFGFAITANVTASELNLYDNFEIDLQNLIVFILLCGFAASTVRGDLFAFLRGQVYAASTKITLRFVVGAIGLWLGVIVAAILIVLFNLDSSGSGVTESSIR